MRALLILNDPPYGTERSYNGLHLAPGIGRSSMAQLAEWTLWADKVITF